MRTNPHERAVLSVAFGSTGCRSLAGGLALFVLPYRGVRGMFPREILELIRLSNMRFPAFPGPELINQEGLVKH